MFVDCLHDVKNAVQEGSRDSTVEQVTHTGHHDEVRDSPFVGLVQAGFPKPDVKTLAVLMVFMPPVGFHC